MEFKISRGEEKERGEVYTFLLAPLPSLFLIIILIFQFFYAPLVYAAPTDYTQDLNDFIAAEMKLWVNSDIVVDNLNKQNEISTGYSESSLKVLDNSWRAEFRKVNQPLISQVLTSELSQFLQKKVGDSAGVITQLKILDSKGLSIAQTIISEDYLNAGKPRWDKTFKEKSYTPYISEVYYSDETNKFQVEVSFLIIVADLPAGVIIAGIDVEQLEDWKKRRK